MVMKGVYDPTIEEKILSLLGRGYSLESIRVFLLEKGMDPKDIDTAFSRVDAKPSVKKSIHLHIIILISITNRRITKRL